jgi:hypothetical protein
MASESSEFWNGPFGKGIVIAGGVVFLGVVFWIFRPTNPAREASSQRIFIDSKTMQPFDVTLREGMMVPIKAPSGGNTGYPAELCYWTKDGGTRKTPYAVLLKNVLNPNAGPTFCPDCGRLVRPHNPAPGPGVSVPPTEAEYNARRGNRGDSLAGDNR